MLGWSLLLVCFFFLPIALNRLLRSVSISYPQVACLIDRPLMWLPCCMFIKLSAGIPPHLLHIFFAGLMSASVVACGEKWFNFPVSRWCHIFPLSCLLQNAGVFKPSWKAVLFPLDVFAHAYLPFWIIFGSPVSERCLS